MGLTKPIEQIFIKLSRYIYVSKNIIRGEIIMALKDEILQYLKIHPGATDTELERVFGKNP